MRSKDDLHHPTFLVIAFVIVLMVPNRAFAHCDGLDGPVVKAAQKALATGDVNLVLIWVQKSDETEIRKAFEQTAAVRKLSAEARELADRYYLRRWCGFTERGKARPTPD